MKWKVNHPVTVKKLTADAIKNGQIDLMINELKFYRRIAHGSKVLSLMGFCQCDHAENMFLIFERIQISSLFITLHQMEQKIHTKERSVFEIALNICDALMFLHDHNIIHNYVNSHSIFLTDMHTAKLGNLEYAVEK
jgi:serine/threonine protein kinase